MELRSEQAEGENYFQSDDAIFALATVLGKSAVAVFRCSGVQVWQNFESSFSRYAALREAPSHTAVYGFLQDSGCGDQQNGDSVTTELLDEVLLLKFCAPRSYSGQDMLEIHCHGSIAVLDAVRSLLLRLGLRAAERGEFTYRSIKHGKRSLHQAEAIALLADSCSQNQRRSALEQLNSPLSEKLQQIRGQLLQVLARSELQLDYDESELEFNYQLPDSLGLAQSSLQYLQNSLAGYQLARSSWRECKVVLAGATNSGKSSLFNSLLMCERSIVSQQAGTTRDYLEARFELAGQGILLYDTAGLRYDSDDPIEKQGIQRSWQLLEQADFLLLLVDIRLALQDFVHQYGTFEPLRSWIAEEYLTYQGNDTNDALAQLHSDRSKIGQLAAERQLPLIEIWSKSDLLLAPYLLESEAQRLEQGAVAKVSLSELQQFCQKQLQKEFQSYLPAQCDAEKSISYRLLFCSAHSGQGLPELINQLQNGLPQYSSQRVEAPVSERQAELLRQAAELLQEYCNGLQGMEHELFDLDWGSELLRQICGRLGEVSGEACNAAMLRQIFGQFCVGK